MSDIKVTVTLRKHVAERLRAMCHARKETATDLIDRWIFEHDDQGNAKPIVTMKSRSDQLVDALFGGPFDGPFPPGRGRSGR